MNNKLAKPTLRELFWLSMMVLAAFAPGYAKAADEATSTGTFLNPVPTCPPAVCDGTGTNSFSWGAVPFGQPSSLTFAGNSFAPSAGDTFKLGTLTYHNSETTGGTEVSGVGFDIAVNFNNTNKHFAFHTSLSINTTPNTGTPEQNADYVGVTDNRFPYTFHVLEGATASADIMVTLAPAGSEIQSLSLANPTAGGFIGVVPEPSIFALMLAGLSLIGLSARKRRIRNTA